MQGETSGLVGVEEENGMRKYLKRYFWGIKVNVWKLVWFIYEYATHALKAIRQFLDNFIGFFIKDGCIVYKVYNNEELPPNHHCSACLTHIRRKFVESLEEKRSVFIWFIAEIGELFAIEHNCKKAGYDVVRVRAEGVKRSKLVMD